MIRKPYHKVWMASVLGWTSLYMSRMIFTPALPSIMDEYRITYTQAGILASAVFWIYAPMMFLSGYLGDRWGRKRILLAGMLGWSILCFFTPWAHSLTALFLFRFFMGLSQGTYFGNDRAILTAYTPPRAWGLAQGITMMGAGWGNFLALFLGGWVVGTLGWRYIFYFVGGASWAVALFSLRFIPSLPSSTTSAPTDRAFRWREVLFRRELLILYLLGFIVMNIFWIFGIWIPSIFMEMGIPSPMEASLYGSLYALGGIPGMVVFGLFTDWAQKRWKVERSTVLALSLSLTTIFLLALSLSFRPGVGITSFCTLVALLGFFIPGLWPPLYALIAQFTPPKALGTVYGLSNSIAFLGAILAPIMAGFLKDWTQSFGGGFYLGSIAMGAAAILAWATLPRAFK